MSKNQISAHIEENGESKYSVNISVSGHSLKGDEPLDFGGGNLGPAPYDLLLAALGECTAMTVRWYAIQKNWSLEKVEVNMTHQKVNASDLPEAAGSTGEIDLFRKEIIVYGDKLSEEQRNKLVEVAAKCPVQRTLESDIVIRTVYQK